jgi:hypothetical protein
MDRDDLRALDALLGNDHPDVVLDGMLPYVRLYLDAVPALRALPLGEVPNALTLDAGGRG